MSTLQHDLRKRDRVWQKAGKGLSLSISKQATAARVLGVCQPDISKWTRGMVNNDFARLFERVVVLADAGCDVAPMLVELMDCVERASVEKRPTEELVAEWWELTRREHQDQAAEDAAHGCRMIDLMASAEADKREAATQIRRAAISEELHERITKGEAEADPYHPTWRAR